MKQKIYMSLMLMVLLATTATSKATTLVLNNAPTTTVLADNEAVKKANLVRIKARVEEIKDMDKSTLNSADRKALRKELRVLGKEARNNGGVYLSVGAIVIIILLLILIL
jgi:hypothetical protein